MVHPAYGGKARQVAAKGGIGIGSEPDRARLKDVRTRPSKALSAHLFFVAFCRQLQPTCSAAFPVITGSLLSYAWRQTL